MRFFISAAGELWGRKGDRQANNMAAITHHSSFIMPFTPSESAIEQKNKGKGMNKCIVHGHGFGEGLTYKTGGNDQ
jgi:hypothetical protein